MNAMQTGVTAVRAGRRLLTAALLGTVAWAPFSDPAMAQGSYPDRPIRLIVPFVPGGITDATARIVAEQMSNRLGQPVVVDNRAGASGNIGTKLVASADPDGYTLVLVPDSNMVISPLVYKDLGYDPLKDFAAVGKVGDSTLALVSAENSKLRTLDDVIAAAKRSDGGLFYATSGVGSNSQIAAELLKDHAKVNLVHVPYNKGAGPALADLMGGQIPLVVTAVTGAIPLIKGGKVHPIVVFTSARSSSLPDVPTASESGWPAVYNSWIGIFAPARTPKPVLAKLSSVLQSVITSPATNARLVELGVVPVPSSTPESFMQDVKADLERYAPIVKKANVAVD